MNVPYLWYEGLVKPTWAPPEWLFEPVWTVLYFIIAFSFVTVFHKVYRKELPGSIALPFALNLVFNFLFNPLQLVSQNGYLAAADIILVFLTLTWAILAIYPRIRWVALVNIPYFLWIFFTAVLQITIVFLNK